MLRRRHARFLPSVCACVVGLWSGAMLHAAGDAPVSAPETLTRIEEVRALTSEQAAAARPVKIQGVVTWKTGRGMTIQNGASGTWLHMPEARAAGIWKTDPAVVRAVKVGDVVEVEGRTVPGAYAPGVMPATIRVIGHAPLPPAAPMVPARFFSGADDGVRVEVRGVVQAVQRGDAIWNLRVDADPGLFAVEIVGSAVRDPESLVDSEVRVTGVGTVRFNTRGEITMPRVFASQPDELVIEKPGTAAFSAPLVPLAHVLPYRKEPTGPHRVRVIGTVTHALRGHYLFLQEGDSTLRVQTRSDVVFQPGDRVEASGFAEMSRYVGGLAEAQVRKIGTGAVPQPVEIEPEAIIRLNEDALMRGLRAKPHDFDGHLVRFRARLLAVQSAPESTSLRRLVLQRGDSFVNAVYAGADRAGFDRLLPGSEVAVTGIVQLEYTPVDAQRSALSLMPNRLSLLLRQPADVAVLRAPSWWTPERLLGAVAIVALALGAALLWVWQLRRQVRRKADQLAQEIRARRDAAVEFQASLRERNRLAANLHDTLLQTLGGIGFEIGACEAEAAVQAKPLPRLAVARRILDVAVAELRNSVWALRTLPLASKGLDEALRAVAARESAGKSVQIDFSVEGDCAHIPDFVAGNLVLVAQEALRNAIRHGRPTRIAVSLAAAPKRDLVQLSVIDDGVGFTPGEQAGAAQGHFGLVGMRERVERLDGVITVESAPGEGTKVRLAVPLRSYDQAVA